MPCIVPHEKYGSRLVFGLFCSCTGVFIYLFTVVFFDWLRCSQKSIFVDYDIKTITAADYSIEFNLSPEQWTHW